MSNLPDWDETEVEVSVTFKTRYKVLSEYYGESKTLEEAMSIDMESAKDDPYWVMIVGDNVPKIETSWRKI